MTDQSKTTHDIAVALHYDGVDAPRVSAQGQGETARRILEIAQANDIPLQSDPELAAILGQIPLGEEIPETLYQAVAEVIAFAYLLTGKRPPGFSERETPSLD